MFRLHDLLRHRSVLAALIAASSLALLLPTVPLHAQADSLAAVVTALEPGQRVRLELQAGEGRLVGHLAAAEDSWILQLEDERRPVRPAEIRRLWAEVGDHAGEGLLFGTLAGTAAGAVIGAVAVEATNSRGFSRGGGALVGGLVGFFPGLFTGVAIGANTPKWELRYSSELEGIAASVRVR